MDIDLPKLLTRVRAGQSPVLSDQSAVSSHGLSTLGKFFMWIYSRLARSPRLFSVSQKIAALGTRLVAPFDPYVRLPAFTGWGLSKDLPRFAGKTFRDRFADEESRDGQVHTGTGARVSPVLVPAQEASATVSPVTTEPCDDISRFTQELIKVNGNVIRTNTTDLTDHVIEFLRSRAIFWIHLEPAVLEESALQQAGISVSHAPDAAIRAGVTRAICGIADTGSILVVDGGGDPLLASLLPRIHIAILHDSDILPSLADALHLPVAFQSASTVVITGPSRTADIEMSLTIGMHGPAELHVFLVDD